MNRFLLFVIVLYAIWRVLTVVGKRLNRRSAGAEDYSRFSARRRGRDGEAPNAGRAPDESLAPCSVCGTLVPESRMLRTGANRQFCGTACLRAAEGPRTGR
jgi:hypothetical protein